MNGMRIIFLFAFILFSLDAAAGQKFRSGEIIGARLSDKALVVNGLNKYDHSNTIKTKAYAAVYTKLDHGRSIGIYDYVLTDGKTEFPCVALREDDGAFDAGKWEYPGAVTDTHTYTMLFVVNGPAPKDASVKYTLKSKLFDNTLNPIVEFKNIKAAPLDTAQGVLAEYEKIKAQEAAEAERKKEAEAQKAKEAQEAAQAAAASPAPIAPASAPVAAAPQPSMP